VTLYERRTFDLHFSVSCINGNDLAAKRLSFTGAIVTGIFLPGDEDDLVAALDLATYCSCLNRFHFFS
jgi:hypothetical protein